MTFEDNAQCICIPECPEENDPHRRVCTSRNETWASDCEVFKQRCFCDTKDVRCNRLFSNIYIDYYGECRQLVSKLFSNSNLQCLKPSFLDCIDVTLKRIQIFSRNFESSLKKHLMSNECISKELCQTSFRVNFLSLPLAEKLEPYIDAFKNSIDEKRFERNQKIKDRLDEYIYFIIEGMIITKKGFENAKCIAEYLRRKHSKVIDKNYSVDLLFEEEKLWRIVEQLVNNYPM